MHIIKAFFKNVFVRNVILAVIVFFLLLWGINLYLKSSTCLGCQISVPDFKGLSEAEVKELCELKELRYVIRDTDYVKEVPRNAIVMQQPGAESMVKKGRTIYLSINASSPKLFKIKEEELKDKPARQATKYLENNGFIIDPDWEYVPNLTLDWVLEIKYKDEVVEWGTKLPKGAELTLVVGNGNTSGKELHGPDWIGHMYADVKYLFAMQGRIEGKLDTTELRGSPLEASIIYKVLPDTNTIVKPSEPIDIFVMDSFAFRNVYPEDFKRTKDRR